MGGAYKDSTLDHVLLSELPKDVCLHEVQTFNSLQIADHSDHKPVALSLAFYKFLPKSSRRIKQLPYVRPDIDQNNKRETEKFAKLLDAAIIEQQIPSRPSPDQPVEDNCVVLNRILALTIQVVKSKEGLDEKRKTELSVQLTQTRPPFKDGYSIGILLRKAHLDFYKMVLCYAFTGKKHSRSSNWEKNTFRPGPCCFDG